MPKGKKSGRNKAAPAALIIRDARGARGGKPAAPRAHAQATATEARADERLVERAVAHLRRLVVGGQVQLMAEVGEYLIKEFYGSTEAARSRDPHKPASLSRLAGRTADFGMSPAQLSNAVPIALAVRDLGLELSHELGVSRLRLVARIRDDQQRRLVAETATASGWTVDKLQERLRKLQRPHAGGRPSQPAVAGAVTRLDRAVAEELGDMEALHDDADEVAPRAARALLGRVNHMQERMEKLEKLLQRIAARAADGG